MSAEIGTLEYWQEVAEAVTDDARKLRAELTALRAERDALRAEVEMWKERAYQLSHA